MILRWLCRLGSRRAMIMEEDEEEEVLTEELVEEVAARVARGRGMMPGERRAAAAGLRLPRRMGHVASVSSYTSRSGQGAVAAVGPGLRSCSMHSALGCCLAVGSLRCARWATPTTRRLRRAR